MHTWHPCTHERVHSTTIVVNLAAPDPPLLIQEQQYGDIPSAMEEALAPGSPDILQCLGTRLALVYISRADIKYHRFNPPLLSLVQQKNNRHTTLIHTHVHTHKIKTILQKKQQHCMTHSFAVAAQ